ncbi:putative monogalactosyldiacylglycerol synthase 2 [Nymphaea thermarum]|nr:putative monogalactosyldiacylglycerol synthase 2 [Nymphaea thermarum]
MLFSFVSGTCSLSIIFCGTKSNFRGYGEGMGSVEETARALEEALYDELLGKPIGQIVRGFEKQMEKWMAACDCIITKVGPGTIAEALICGLPIILNDFIPGQALVLGAILDAHELRKMSQNALKLAQPEAVFNIVRDIDELMHKHGVLSRIKYQSQRVWDLLCDRGFSPLLVFLLAATVIFSAAVSPCAAISIACSSVVAVTIAASDSLPSSSPSKGFPPPPVILPPPPPLVCRLWYWCRVTLCWVLCLFGDCDGRRDDSQDRCCI